MHTPFVVFRVVGCDMGAERTISYGPYDERLRSTIDAGHHLQVYEKAQCLIGVYTCNGSSQAVTLSCEE